MGLTDLLVTRKSIMSMHEVEVTVARVPFCRHQEPHAACDKADELDTSPCGLYRCSRFVRRRLGGD